MKNLLSLPNEVLHGIVKEVNGSDLSSLSQCCKTLHEFIKDNRLLHKQIYLRCFDDPTLHLTEHDPEPDWDTLLPEAVRLQKLLKSENVQVKRANLTFIANTVITLLRTSSGRRRPSINVKFLEDLFQPRVNIDTLLCSSSLFAQAGSEDCKAATTEEERQLSAQLHCLYGVPVEGREKGCVPTHPYACARVYDLRRYTTNTLWGPFREDGSHRVDWERMEAVMIVLGHNLQVFIERLNGAIPPVWEIPFAGATPFSYRSAQPAPPLELQDPYNITGTYMRVVCFLDYSELFAFNFATEPPPLEEDRAPLNSEEALRLITMRLRATSIEEPGEHDGKALPVVNFKGTSRSLHASWDPNANSDIRGSVRLTPEGEVRWTTYSIYSGEERWKSEGIQIGGLESARGVLGNWFDKNYDPQGPAGPTAFWKMSDEIPEEKGPLLRFMY